MRPIAKHHAQFYFEDGVVFLVGDKLFKVPRDGLVCQSEVIANMFSKLSGGEMKEGRSDTKPISLPHVAAIDFERLLTLLYPVFTSQGYPWTKWTVSEWTSVLRLALKWEMQHVFAMAMKKVAPLATPVDKVVLGINYERQQWILDGLVDLCLREDPLSEKEARRLGVGYAVKFAAAREKIRVKVLELGQNTIYHTPHGDRRIPRGKLVNEEGAIYRGNLLVKDVIEETFEVQIPWDRFFEPVASPRVPRKVRKL